jgi:hypothetical protein
VAHALLAAVNPMSNLEKPGAPLRRREIDHVDLSVTPHVPKSRLTEALVAIRMLPELLTAHHPRSRRAIDQETARRRYPGDVLVAQPRWGWTHAVEITAPSERIWPWVSQIAAHGGRFYNLQIDEPLLAARAVHAGDGVLMHPRVPPLRVIDLVVGHHFVAFAGPDIIGAARPWIAASWLFLIEALGDNHSRLISRYRAATSDDLRTRLASGEFLIAPIGRAMDWRLLRGIKARAEYRDRGDPNA